MATPVEQPSGVSSDQLLASGPPAPQGESDIIGGYAGPVSPVGRTVKLTGPQGAVPVQDQLNAQQPAYMSGEERNPASLPVEDVAALQLAMSRAGVLTGEFRVGVWDSKSMNAYKGVLAFANQEGVSDLDALNVLASAPRAGGPAAFRPGKYLPPDPAVHREAVRGMFAEALDREPDDDELDRFASMLRDAERGAFREARQAWRGTGGGAEDFNAAYSRTAEDASARFAEAFQRRIRPEVEFKQRQADSAESYDLLAGILGTIDEVV